MERVYVRFSPGISLDEANARIQAMAKMLARELPKGDVDARPHERRVAGERAERDDEPERRAAHGLHPRGAGRARAPKALAAGRSRT